MLTTLFSLTFSAVNEPLLSGIITDKTGRPVANADVCLYRANYVSNEENSQKRFPRGASRCRKTDKEGAYKLYFPDRSTYILIASKKSDWAMRTITPSGSSDTFFIADTLTPTGTLTFTVNATQSSDHRAKLSLRGTPYSFMNDTLGRFSLKNIPGGTYSAIIQSLQRGYQTVQCSLRVRSGVTDNVTATLTLPKESIAYVPSAVQTIGNDTAKTPPAAPVNKVPAPKPLAPDTVGAQKKSVAPPLVTASPPAKPPVAKAPADTFIGIFESLILQGTTTDENSIVTQEWDIGSTGRFIPTPDGKIELPPFKAPVNRLACIFRVKAASGLTATDTTFVYAGLLWMSITPPKELLGRNGHSFLTFNDALYIIGGNRSDAWNSSDGINWTLLTSTAPFGKLFGHTTVVFNKRLWIFGGKTGPDTYNHSIWSSSTGVEWQREGELPFPVRLYHAAAVFNDKIWIIGGITNSENEPFLNDIWSSADGRSWNRITGSAPFGKRYGHSCTTFNNQLILLGGFNDAVGEQKSYSDVWKSADGVAWEKVIDNAPFSGNNYHSVCVFDNKLWAVGGYSRKNETDYFADILFTTNGSTWTDLTADKTSADRFFCASVPFNNRIIVSPSDSHKLWVMR